MKLTFKQRIYLIRIIKILVFSAAVLITTKLTLEFGMHTKESTAAFSFLIIVLLSAFFGDIIVAIITSLVATLCFDFFYLPPTGTFNINAFADWISLIAFLLASVIISHLTASAAKYKAKVVILNKSLLQTKDFGKYLLSLTQEHLTLSGIVKKAKDIFSLEYCSIHVYGEGKWQHFTGTSSSDIPKEIENKLKNYQDHTTDLFEIANENMMGVTFTQIDKGHSTLALLAIKSKSFLPIEVIGAIAYMIGVRINMTMKD